MKKLVIGLMTLTSASTFAANLNMNNLKDVIDTGLLSEVRVTLDQQLTSVYQISKTIDKSLVDKGLTSTTTENLILRKINMNTKGKIVSFDAESATVKVSFEKGCEEEKCLYTFKYIASADYAIDLINAEQFVFVSAPKIPGYTFMKANSGLLPFTDAFKAIDKANLLINSKDIVQVNKEVEELGGFDSEEEASSEE